MEGGGTVNSDIRLAIGFWDHPKIVKLERRTGVEGVKSLLILWQWVAQCKPNGYLYGMDMDDVEIASRWHGGVGELCKNLVDLRLLDVLEGGIGFKVHDWEIHNPWASEAQKREDEARLASLKRWNRKVYEELVSQGLTSITKEDYLRVKNGLPMGTHRDPNGVPNAPSPSPSPSPVPSPVPSPEKNIKHNSQQPQPECPHQKIIELYGEVLPMLPQPKTWTTVRQKYLRSRWNESNDRKNLEWWRYFFMIVKDSPFLMGHNDRGWTADLEWLVRPTNFAKVLDGKYLEKRKTVGIEDLDPDDIIEGMFSSVRDDDRFDAITVEGSVVT